MSDFEEKTRVTQVVQKPVGDEATGNDCLVIIYAPEPNLLGKRFVLDRAVVRAGRGSDNTIVLEGDSVSRRHARFEKRNNRWWVLDLRSTNGTYVNEDQVEVPEEAPFGDRVLGSGDRIKIGPAILKFLSGADAEAKYHEEIYRMTIVDGLTQAHNKRYLFEVLERECVRARRHARPLSLVMFDIDHFKKVNDQFGHLAGDYALRELSKVCQERIRKEETFARYGGEEFTVVLPETPLEGAVSLAEDLRARIASHEFVFQNEPIPITISLGAAQLADADKTALELVQRADEQLYAAKRSGRNRVCS